MDIADYTRWFIGPFIKQLGYTMQTAIAHK